MFAGGTRMTGVDGAEWHPAEFASVAGDPLDSARAHDRIAHHATLRHVLAPRLELRLDQHQRPPRCPGSAARI